MTHQHTLQEAEFLAYFRRINKRAIERILSQYRSTGPTAGTRTLRAASDG